MKPRSIVVATRNPGKLREIRQILASLNVAVVALDDYPDLSEPEETGSTFAENARQKALYYARATGQWCLADDSGLVVDALGGEPGVISARYAADDVPPGSDRRTIDQANNRKLIRQLQSVPDEQRTARFVCCLALTDPDKVLLETEGRVEGRICRSERGSNGFGYDPLFVLPDRGVTTAELPPEQKNSISHRGEAVRKMAVELAKLLPRN